MTTHAPEGAALLKEVVAVLSEYGDFFCAPSVELVEGRDGVMALTLAVYVPQPSDHLSMLAWVELVEGLRRVADISQLRALACRYDIDPSKLEALLPALKEVENG